MKDQKIRILCILNSVLALGLIGFTISREVRQGSKLPMRETNHSGKELVTLTEAELLERAVNSENLHESQVYFQELAKRDAGKDFLLTAMEAHFSKEQEVGKLAPYSLALLQAVARVTETAEELRIFAELAKDPSRPLELRDAAFRAHVESSVQINKPNESYDLINRLYTETNSLKGTALRAEEFLHSKVEGEHPARLRELHKRVLETARSGMVSEANQYAALEILGRLNTAEKEAAIRAVYEQARSERLQLLSLRILATEVYGREPPVWLGTLKASSPELEKAILAIMEGS